MRPNQARKPRSDVGVGPLPLAKLGDDAEIGAGRTGAVERLLPDLCHLAVLNFLGEDEAWLELGSPELPQVDPSD